MQEPHPGRNPSLIRFASPSGKYEFSKPNLDMVPSSNYGILVEKIYAILCLEFTWRHCIDWLIWLIDWPIDWLIDWLIDWSLQPLIPLVLWRTGLTHATRPYMFHGPGPWLRLGKLSLLGLMAKIKCSICSYQFNIWYAGHRPAHILIWFLAFGQGSEVYLTLTTGCLGIALQPSAAHLYLQKKK